MGAGDGSLLMGRLVWTFQLGTNVTIVTEVATPRAGEIGFVCTFDDDGDSGAHGALQLGGFDPRVRGIRKNLPVRTTSRRTSIEAVKESHGAVRRALFLHTSIVRDCDHKRARDARTASESRKESPDCCKSLARFGRAGDFNWFRAQARHSFVACTLISPSCRRG